MSVSVEATPEVVGAGAPVLASFEVENGGNADMPELRLRLDLRRLANAAVVLSFDRDQALARGEMGEGSFGVSTLGLAEEDYLLT